MLTTNKIPQAHAQVTNLALIALNGALSHGAGVGLQHNPAPLLAADFHDYAGDPATPLVPGKQAQLTAQLLAIKNAQLIAVTAIKAGRDFCHTGIGVLKPIFGHRWNNQWLTAGFTEPSLAVPPMPLAMLVQFRTFLEANPARESATLGFTAAQAQAKVAGIQAAVLARDNARGARWSVKAARDAAFKQLRKRLSDLRGELSQLLLPTDDRWYAFGFRRPADGSMPSLVPDLVVTPGGPGIVLAQWGLASLAENYRVSWRIVGNPAEPTELGLFTERQCALTGLASGTNIVVLVSARNDSGETEPTEAAILVP